MYAETTHPSAALDAFHSVRRRGSAAAGSCDGRRTSAKVAARARERDRICSCCKSVPILILISNGCATQDETVLEVRRDQAIFGVPQVQTRRRPPAVVQDVPEAVR